MSDRGRGEFEPRVREVERARVVPLPRRVEGETDCYQGHVRAARSRRWWIAWHARYAKEGLTEWEIARVAAGCPATDAAKRS